VILLKRDEAILILNEIFGRCTSIDGRYLALMPPHASNLLSAGYQIVIKTDLDEETRTCMQDILMKNHLSIKVKEQDEFIIYRPIMPKDHHF
jgi:hypothetical protein